MIKERLKMFHKFFSDKEMDFWRFFLDTRIFYGRDETIVKFPEIVSMFGTRIGVLTDENVSKLNFTKKYLSKIEGNILLTRHIGFEGDYDDIINAVEAFKEKNIDVIVAIGGGSVLDGAKAVSVLMNNNIRLSDLELYQSIENIKIPLVVIPTTFGTGSEVNCYIFVNNKGSKSTNSFKKAFLIPEVAIINPDVIKETPSYIKYLNGIEAFLHNLEVLSLKREKSPIQEMLMSGAVKLFCDNFKAYIENPNDENEDAIATVALLGGIGVNNSRPGLIHSLAKGIDEYYDVPHPVSLIPFILPVLKLNWEYLRGYFNDISFEQIRTTIKEEVLFRNVPELENIEIDEDLAEKMTEVCLKDTVIVKENSAPINKDTIMRVFLEAFKEKELTK